MHEGEHESNKIRMCIKISQYNLTERRRGSVWDSSMNVTYMYTSVSQNGVEENDASRNSTASQNEKLSKKSSKTQILNEDV